MPHSRVWRRDPEGSRGCWSRVGLSGVVLGVIGRPWRLKGVERVALDGSRRAS